MFYNLLVLGKKGPLSKVWLAAHWDKKLTRHQILQIDIKESVDGILDSRVGLSLRTSSHLMLGVVRIYSRKVKYLLDDCQDAAFKAKHVRLNLTASQQIELPSGMIEASLERITMQEVLEFANLEADVHFDTRLYDQTLTASRLQLPEERTATQDEFDEFLREASRQMDEGSKMQDGMTIRYQTFQEEASFHDFLHAEINENDFGGAFVKPTDQEGPPEPEPELTQDVPIADLREEEEKRKEDAQETTDRHVPAPELVLPPLTTTVEPVRRRGRKSLRRDVLLIDRETRISNQQLVDQEANFEDTMIPLDIAPPTKKLMEYSMFGHDNMLLSRPAVPLVSRELSERWKMYLVTQRREQEEDDMEAEVPVREHPPAPEEEMPFLPPEIELPTELEGQSHQKPPKASKKRGRAEESPLREREKIRRRTKEGEASAFDFGMSTFVPIDTTEIMDQPPIVPSQESPLSEEDQATQDRASQFRESQEFRLAESLEDMFKVTSKIKFSELVERNTKKQVACKFFALLEMHKHRAVVLKQKRAYEEIDVIRGPSFDEHLNSFTRRESRPASCRAV